MPAAVPPTQVGVAAPGAPVMPGLGQTLPVQGPTPGAQGAPPGALSGPASPEQSQTLPLQVRTQPLGEHTLPLQDNRSPATRPGNGSVPPQPHPSVPRPDGSAPQPAVPRPGASAPQPGVPRPGGSTPPPPQPSAPRPAGPAALKSTVMGMGLTPPAAPSPTSPTGAVVQPTGHTDPLRGTMVGIAPPGLLPAGTGGAAPAAAGRNKLQSTMIGVAPPPPNFSPATAAPEQPGAASMDPPAATTPGLGNKRTMVGIARPGIAPLNPGVEKPRAPDLAPDLSPPPWPPTEQAGAPAEVPPGARPLRIPPGAAIAIVGAAALLTAAGVALLLYRARGSVEATLTSGPDGSDRLALVCKGCPDGSTVSAGGKRATFHAGRAEVPLAQKLAVGDNTVPVVLERRPGKTEPVEVSVPVDFRIRADTSGLAQSPPRVIVRVEAVPHSAIVVEGKPVALAPTPAGAETGSAEIDVSRALTGGSSAVSMLERTIPYVVTPPNGSSSRGEVRVRIGVTPLVVQAPGPSIVIETSTFVLAGHAGKDATVSVEGRPITVDASGAFAQMMSVSSLGETNVTVRADAKNQAPRLVPLRVRRVQSLAAEAKAERAGATTSYAAIEGDPASQRGLAVALDGSVIEARADAFTTILLMDVKSGCAHAPCLARVSIGQKEPLASGSGVSVFGMVAGAVDGPHSGTRIPAILADFVLKGRP